jgi:hypothetical protein
VSNKNENELNNQEQLTTGENVTGAVESDGWGEGLSALLTLPPTAPFVQYGERRSGGDRRKTDRRLTAREFTSSDKS